MTPHVLFSSQLQRKMTKRKVDDREFDLLYLTRTPCLRIYLLNGLDTQDERNNRQVVKKKKQKFSF